MNALVLAFLNSWRGLRHGARTERRGAARVQRLHRSAFGGDFGARVPVFDGRQQSVRLFVRDARFQGERTLSRRGKHLQRIEHLGDLVGAAEPGEPCPGQDDRVVLALGDLAQPGVDVAADPDDLESEAESM